jgi:UrcA family protein
MKIHTLHNTKHIALAAVAAMCLSGAAVHAGETDDVPTVKVRYSGLDLGTQKAANILYNRIRQAAEQVCGDPDPRQLAEAAAAKACVSRAVASSVHAVNDVGLTSVYNSRNGVKTISIASLR